MNRQAMLLTAVGAVLVLALYWMFLLAPKRAELAEITDATLVAVEEQRNLTNQINGLRDIRARAPEVEAQLAATEALVPSNAALPPTLRQLQLAADESGLTLTSVTPSPPGPFAIEGLPAGGGQMSISVVLSGSYFQVIDFLRRTEDPSITPRAVLWQSLSVAPTDYPELGLSLTGFMFTLDRAATLGG